MALSKATPSKVMARALNKNMEFLNSKLENDLELQVLTITFVEDALEERANGGEKKQKSQKGKPAEDAAGDIDDSQPGFKIEVTVEIPRQATKYYGWKKQLITDLFAYCEPKIWSRAKKNVDSLLLLKQLFSFAFGIRCLEEKSSDKTTTKIKVVVFDALRTIYIANGRRLRSVFMCDQFVDWAVEGFFSIEVFVSVDGGARKVKVTDKLNNGKVRDVPEEMMPEKGVELSNKSIEMNFSWDDAFVWADVNKQDKLVLSTLFPKFKRTLTRKITDEAGATAPLEGGSSASGKKRSSPSKSGDEAKPPKPKAKTAKLSPSSKTAAADVPSPTGVDDGDLEAAKKQAELASAAGEVDGVDEEQDEDEKGDNDDED